MNNSLRKLTGLMACLLLASQLGAQALFQKVYHDYDIHTFDVVELPDGGYAISGLAGDSTTNTQKAMVARLSCVGEVEWVKTFGQASATGATSGVLILDDDNNLVTLNNRGFFGSFDALVIKLDLNGNLIWERTVGGPDSDAGQSLIQTSDGGYAVAGYTETYLTAPSSFRNIYLFKLDKSGNLLWTQSYGIAAGQSEGDELVETPDGGLAVCGRAFLRGYFHAYILKTNGLGQIQWAKAYGGDDATTRALDIINTSDGGLALTGYTSIANGSWNATNDLFMVKTDAQGDTLWTRIYTNSFTQNPSDRELGYQLTETHDQELAAVGITYSFPFTGFVSKKIFLVKADQGDGSKQLAKTFGQGNDDYPAIKNMSDGGYAIICFTGQPSYGMIGPFGAYLIRTDSNFTSTPFGCDEAIVTNNTFELPTQFWQFDTTFSNLTGGTAANSAVQDTYELALHTVCQNWVDIVLSPYDDTICLGDTAYLVAVTDPPTVVYWYASDTSDSVVYTGDTFALPNLTGSVTYYCEPLGWPDCDTLRIPATVTFLGVPLANPTASPNPAVYPEVTVQFGSGAGPGINSWLWNFGDSSNSTQSDPSHEYMDPGLFEVTLEMVDSSGCVQLHNLLVQVEGDTLGIPNVITPNEDGFNDLLLAEHFGIVSFNIVVYDRWGRQHYQSDSKKFNWDGTNSLGKPLSEGVYYYIVEGETYQGEEKRFAGNITILR